MFKLEYKLIYALIVAGKSASFAEDVMKRLFFHRLPDESYLDEIRKWIAWSLLRQILELARTGNYTKLVKAFTHLTEHDYDLATATPEELEQIPGVGPKTSRFFILWTRPNARYAALDVHVLRWLAGQGYDVPRTIPTGKKYAEIEGWFIAESDKRGVLPATLDNAIWVEGSKHRNRNAETALLVK